MLKYEQIDSQTILLDGWKKGFKGGIPVLPLKILSDFYVMGWDIKVVYCVDANNQIWIDNGHGGSFYSCSFNDFCVEAEDTNVRNKVRACLGMKPEPETWMVEAKRNNWTPPSNFNEDLYDWVVTAAERQNVNE